MGRVGDWQRGKKDVQSLPRNKDIERPLNTKNEGTILDPRI